MIAGRDDLIPALVPDPESSPEAREEWLEYRRGGYGGSDAAALLGEVTERAPIDVWRERVGLAAPNPDNERTRAGRWLEPIVLDEAARGGERWPRTGGAMVAVKPPSVYHRVRPWQRGSVDALLYYPETVIDLGVPEHGGLVRGSSFVEQMLWQRRPEALGEAKTHGWFGSRAYNLSHDGDPIISVPGDKRVQVAWYQALYGLSLAYLFALVDTHLRRTFVLQRDQALEDMMLEEVDLFHRRYVLTEIQPPPDGTERYTQYLRDRFRKHRPELVDTTDTVDVAVETLLAVKKEEKRLKKDRELAEQVIKTHVGDAGGVRSKFGPVTWNSQPSGKIKQNDALAELYAALGWTDDEIAAFEAKHQQPDHRVLRTPPTK